MDDYKEVQGNSEVFSCAGKYSHSEMNCHVQMTQEPV